MAEVVIAGGGPAGAATAIGLRQLGHSVCICERARFPRPHIGESLPPRVLPLLGVLGVSEAVERAGFVRMSGTTVHLGLEVVTHDFDPERRAMGIQAERGRFDQLLLEHARAMGAEVREEHAALTPIFGPGEQIAGLRTRSQGQVEELPARFVVDATGSQAVLSRALGARRREAIRTVALTDYYRGARLPSSFPASNTLFEMRPEGWLWSVLLGDGRRNVTVGLDPGAIKGRGAEPAFEAMVAESELVAELVRGAERSGTVEAHDATWSTAEVLARPGFLVVGDSASIIDPLTSQGVYKALHAGITAAAVIHTALTRPEDAAMALAHYAQEQAGSFEKYTEIALSFYRGSPHAEAPFWAERMRHGLGEGVLSPERVEARGARRERFLEKVRGEGGHAFPIHARPSLTLADRPCVERGLVVLRPAWVSVESPRFQVFSEPGRVELHHLHPLLDGRGLEQVFEGYVERSGVPRSADQGKALLQLLIRLAEEGLLELDPSR